MTLAKLLMACAALVAVWLPLYVLFVVRDTGPRTAGHMSVTKNVSMTKRLSIMPPRCWCGQPPGHQLDWVAEILAAPVAALRTPAL
jgi:hypothetical protein